jgi:hypothetical protein
VGLDLDPLGVTAFGVFEGVRVNKNIGLGHLVEEAGPGKKVRLVHRNDHGGPFIPSE